MSTPHLIFKKYLYLQCHYYKKIHVFNQKLHSTFQNIGDLLPSHIDVIKIFSQQLLLKYQEILLLEYDVIHFKL